VTLDPLGLQCGLHVVHGVLDPRMDAMSPVHHNERLLQRRGDAVAEIGPELDQLSLGHAARSQALLDVRLVELGLGLREPAHRVGVDREQPDNRFVWDFHTAEEGHDVEQREVVFPRSVVWVGRLEADRLVKALHERLGDAALGGDDFVPAIESSGRQGRGVEERDRESFLVHETRDGLGRKPGLRPRV
jgi:hypothetical protein